MIVYLFMDDNGKESMYLHVHFGVSRWNIPSISLPPLFV